MDIDLSAILHGSLNVLLTGLVLGAGLPLLFSLGIVLADRGAGGEMKDGTVAAPSAAAKHGARAIFALVALIVVYGLLFITRKSLSHYLGIDLPLG